MHELSIVTYVLDEVRRLAEENGLTRVNSVTMEYGEVSGIVPEYLADCWDWYACKTPLISGSTLRHEVIPAITWCSACRQTYPPVQHGKICPNCGSAETWLKQGNEINLKELEAY